jgi:protein-tyrosine phosphatase
MIEVNKQQLINLLLSSRYEDNIIVDTRGLTEYHDVHLKHSIHLPLSACLERRQPEHILKLIGKEEIAKLQNSNIILVKNSNKTLFHNFCKKLSTITNDSNVYIYKCDDNGAINAFANFDETLLEKGERTEIGMSLSSTPFLFREMAGEPSISKGINQISDWLFITNAQTIDFTTEDKLKEFGIEAIINCASECNDPNIKLPYLHLNLTDDGKHCLSENIVKQVLDFVKRYNKVVVFCYAGISRSVAVAMSLIMYKQKLSYESALKQVRKVRPQADPSIPFVNFLLHWQRIHNLATPTLVSSD